MGMSSLCQSTRGASGILSSCHTSLLLFFYHRNRLKSSTLTLVQRFMVHDTTLWSPIVSTGINGMYSTNTRKAHTCFTSTKRLPTTELEKHSELVCWQNGGRIPTCRLNGFLCYYTWIRIEREWTAAILAAGRSYIFTGNDCKPKAGRNDVSLPTGSSPVISFNLNDLNCGKVYVCKGGHDFVFYTNAKKWKLGGHREDVRGHAETVFCFHCPQVSAAWESGVLRAWKPAISRLPLSIW